jgi:hypothetical protein
MSKVDRVRMRFVPAWFKPVIRRVARLAGVSTATALRCAIEQNALDGRTRFFVPDGNGGSAAFNPDGRNERDVTWDRE